MKNTATIPFLHKNSLSPKTLVSESLVEKAVESLMHVHCATITAVSLSMFSSNKEFTKAMALLCSLYNVNLSEAGLETTSIWIEGIRKDVSWNLRMSMASQPMAACWSSSSRGIADGKEEGAGHGLVMSRQMLKVTSNEQYRVTGVKSVAAEQELLACAESYLILGIAIVAPPFQICIDLSTFQPLNTYYRIKTSSK